MEHEALSPEQRLAAVVAHSEAQSADISFDDWRTRVERHLTDSARLSTLWTIDEPTLRRLYTKTKAPHRAAFAIATGRV